MTRRVATHTGAVAFGEVEARLRDQEPGGGHVDPGAGQRKGRGEEAGFDGEGCVPLLVRMWCRVGG